MRYENRKRIEWQLLFLLIFWSIASFTLITQNNHLPVADPNSVMQMWKDKFRPSPYEYYPLEYNPYNERMTLIESCCIWIGFFYGWMRLFNIFRITLDDDKECQWEHFWGLCENV